MSNYAVMPLADYADTCNAIREATGDTDTIKSSEVPQKIDELYSAGQLDAVQSAETLKGSLVGRSLVTAKDVSPYKHNVECNVETNNFFYKNGTVTPNNTGLTISYDETNDTYTVNGAVTSVGNVTLSNKMKLPAGTYRIQLAKVSGEIVSVPSGVILLGVFKYGDGNTYLARPSIGSGNKGSSTWGTAGAKTPTNWSGEATVYLQHTGKEITYDNFTFRILINKEKYPYTPYVPDVSGIVVKQYGKNLYPVKNFKYSGKAAGNYDAAQLNSLTYIADYLVGKTITISVKVENSSTNKAGIFVRWITGSSSTSDIGSMVSMDAGISGILTKTVTITERPAPESKLQILLYRNINGTLDTENNITYTELQVEVGSDATPYEQYIDPITYTVNADGSVGGIDSIYPSMTLVAEHTGVVVKANYTKDIDALYNSIQQAVALSGGAS